jgi:hypothetical protein
MTLEGMRTSLNERIERYASINSWIEHNKDLFDSQSDFMLSDIDRKSIISVLSSNDVYGRRMLKPVLARIEEEMNDNSIAINYYGLNIEHILPQNPTEDYWLSRFDTDDQINWTHKIGNLSLITVRKNSQASNYNYEDKIEVYFKADGKASNLAMVNDLQNYDEWTIENIALRNEEMLNHFLKALDLKEVKIKRIK